MFSLKEIVLLDWVTLANSEIFYKATASSWILEGSAAVLCIQWAALLPNLLTHELSARCYSCKTLFLHVRHKFTNNTFLGSHSSLSAYHLWTLYKYLKNKPGQLCWLNGVSTFQSGNAQKGSLSHSRYCQRVKFLPFLASQKNSSVRYFKI